MLNDILVHIGSDSACSKRITSAIALARQHNAHLTGIYIDDWVHRIALLSPEMVPMIIDEHREIWEKQKTDTLLLFTDLLGNTNISNECLTVEGELSDCISHYARFYDLVVVGRHEKSGGTYMHTESVHNVVLESGRPVLALPSQNTSSNSSFKRIAIAWDSSREATRAINDAIPILGLADYVEVLVVQTDSVQGSIAEIKTDKICEHLLRYGIPAEPRFVDPASMSKGEAILFHANDKDIDLLVMGAYGHSRFRETILGGVTRHIIKHSAIPLLLSH